MRSFQLGLCRECVGFLFTIHLYSFKGTLLLISIQILDFIVDCSVILLDFCYHTSVFRNIMLLKLGIGHFIFIFLQTWELCFTGFSQIIFDKLLLKLEYVTLHTVVLLISCCHYRWQVIIFTLRDRTQTVHLLVTIWNGYKFGSKHFEV